MTGRHAAGTASFGDLLRHWRRRRGMSQLDLALEAGVSQRHVSFLEGGRARPSREMVLALAGALDAPLRERNAMLTAAGFATLFRERSLSDPALAQVARILRRILEQHEPFPALVIDARFDLLTANAGAGNLFAFLLGPEGAAAAAAGGMNLMRSVFSPDGLRPHVEDWETLARPLIERLDHEVRATADARGAALLEEVLAMPGVPPDWRRIRVETPEAPILNLAFRKGDRSLRFLTTITTLGTPLDVTLHELRIECLYPADDDTAEVCRALARDALS